MHLVSLTIADFRNITVARIDPDPEGTTVITGPNGTGKTSLLEAVGYLATLQSFRGAPREALVRNGAESAVLRAETDVDGRTVTIEAELSLVTRSRTLVNRQVARRRADLHDALRTTVFTPEAIGVVRGGPGERRRFLDETLTVIDPRAARTAEDVEKTLRQRAALLRSTGRSLSVDAAATLDVWDERLARDGTALVQARQDLLEALTEDTARHYSRLAGRPTDLSLVYRRSWEGALVDALQASRNQDLQRGVTTVGPHRDEIDLVLDGLPARTHASQGEQRSLALALQLAAHQLATVRLGSAPLLLLDDVFSELDPARADALLAGLPAGQALLTTAMPPPSQVVPAKRYLVADDGVVTGPERGGL